MGRQVISLLEFKEASIITISVLSVRNPRFISADKSRIECLAQFSHLKGEHFFVASKDDCEEHGRKIWAECIAGKFGTIEPFVAPHRVENNHTPIDISPELHDFTRFLCKVNEENAKKSFLSVGILWGSMLDYLITDLLDVYFKLNPETKRKGTSLYSKIASCVDFGLIDQSTKERFDIIRIVRNKLAHEWELSLEDVELFEALKKLYHLDHSDLFEFVKDLDFLLQMIFSASCAAIALEVKKTAEHLRQQL